MRSTDDLACPKCGAVLWWQLYDTSPGASTTARCSRGPNPYLSPEQERHRAYASCDWTGKIVRNENRVPEVARDA